MQERKELQGGDENGMRRKDDDARYKERGGKTGWSVDPFEGRDKFTKMDTIRLARPTQCIPATKNGSSTSLTIRFQIRHGIGGMMRRRLRRMWLKLRN